MFRFLRNLLHNSGEELTYAQSQPNAEITVAFTAILTGALPIQKPKITGKTRAELYVAARAACTDGRYVHRILATTVGWSGTVYTEDEGWLVHDPTNPVQLLKLPSDGW